MQKAIIIVGQYVFTDCLLQNCRLWISREHANNYASIWPLAARKNRFLLNPLPMKEFLTLAGAVTPVFLIVAAGLLLRRFNWLTEEADHSLLRICINLLIPALILSSILGNEK